MLNFYYSKGSSALAAHILLEEVDVAYNLVEVPISKGAHLETSFLRRNPKGRIPLLDTPEGTLSENPAILEYIAAKSGVFVPTALFQQAQARSLCAYLAATAHVAFAHMHRGSRWASQPASLADLQSRVAANLTECAQFLNTDLNIAPWALGEHYSFCDPYLFQFTRWLGAADVKLADFPNLAVHHEAMRARSATQRALAAHDLA